MAVLLQCIYIQKNRTFITSKILKSMKKTKKFQVLVFCYLLLLR